MFYYNPKSIFLIRGGALSSNKNFTPINIIRQNRRLDEKEIINIIRLVSSPSLLDSSSSSFAHESVVSSATPIAQPPGPVEEAPAEELHEKEVLLKYQNRSSGRGVNFEYTATFNNRDNMETALRYPDTIFMSSSIDYGQNTLLLKSTASSKMYLPHELKQQNFKKMETFLEGKGFTVITK